MNKVPVEAIVIKQNRQRQIFDPVALQELKNSIEDTGLMHPPVLRREGIEWVLVAGERRLRAIQEIWELGGDFLCDGDRYTPTEALVPFVNLGDLSPLEAEEAELDENLKRRDLTWQEHAAATARLHSLRVAQAAAAAPPIAELVLDSEGKPVFPFPKPRVHTVADTAKELTGRTDGHYQDSVRKEILVARHLDNPAVAKAKTADEAFKILKKQEQARSNLALAKSVGETFTADAHQLLNVDCLDYMKLIAVSPPEAKFDAIVTDPPYGMGADQFGDGGGKLSGIEHRYDDSLESWRLLMSEWCALSFAVTKPQAHAYVMCDFDRFHELKLMMQNAGWYVFRTPIINFKLNSGRVPLPDRGPRRQYEIILYAIKGDKPVTHIYPDVVTTQGDENLSHGAQKPVSLYQNLLQRSIKPGDRVADFFAGSGTIFAAAHSYKVTAIGTELNPEYYGMAARRIQSLKDLDEGSSADLPALM